MRYALRRGENLGDGLRRICRNEVELALAFARGEKESDDTPVHETRKHLKKARAVLRLVRKEIGRGPYQRQDHCLRDVGRLISDVRDAEVRLQTVRQLQGLAKPKKQRKYRKLEEMLLLELENFVAAFAEWHVQAIPILESVRAQIESWPLDRYGWKQLRRTVQQTYKKGRQALGEAKTKGTPECFHELRRRTKQLGYQVRIIRPANPVVLDNLEAELHALGDLLGRAHDLSFLRDRLSREDGKLKKESHELMTVIETSVSDLERGAADLAERFFGERPRDFGRRITDRLEEWNDGKTLGLARKLTKETSRAAVGA